MVAYLDRQGENLRQALSLGLGIAGVTIDTENPNRSRSKIDWGYSPSGRCYTKVFGMIDRACRRAMRYRRRRRTR